MWEVSERKIKSIDSEIFANLLKEQTFNILFFFRNVFGRKLWEARFFFATKEWKAATDDPPNTHATGDFRKLKGLFFLNTPWRSIYSCHI